MRTGRPDGKFAIAIIGGLMLVPAQALAHASERGHVLLLPTGFYLAGGALAVAASFGVLAFLRADELDRLYRARLAIGAIGDGWRLPASLLSFALLAMLVAAGLWGSRDPLSNPLPLTVWTLLWVGLTLLHGLFGNLWAWINPWYGPWRIACSALGRQISDRPPARLPRGTGSWPALVLFVGFAWFELIHPAPDDPGRLAWAVCLYWLFTLVGMLVFGYAPWRRRCEFLSVFFGMASRFGMVGRSTADDGRTVIGLPGARLAATPPLPLSGALFLLAALGSVSFDGLSKTFFWLGINGVNPLEYPGRTALMAVNGIGLAAFCAALAAVFVLCVLAGERLAGTRQDWRRAAGTMVWSLVPIALAYHLAHYLSALLVNGQYALVALSDPFALGWNLFGTADLAVRAAATVGPGAAWVLWNVQAGAIVCGHVFAVLAAHRLASRLYGRPRAALLSQLPLTLLMVAYTVFGLWLLSTPATG